MKKLTLFILAIGCSGGLFSQENDCINFPAQASFVYPLGSNGTRSIDYEYHFSLNVLVGSTCGINGCEVGGILNSNKNDVSGVQIAGIGNITGGNVNGVQVGGIFNLADSLKGIQVNGIFSKSTQVHGIQVSGITAINEGDAHGIQLSGITNMNKGQAVGIQIAGITNINEGDVNGIQLAGILNQAKKLNGLQIGLINITDTIDQGIPIGLVNIVKKGHYDELVISFSDYQNLGFSYKSGTKSFYNIYSVGKNIFNDQLWSAGFGFGHLGDISPQFSFQPELVVYTYFPEDFKGKLRDTYAAHFKFGFVNELTDKLALSFAPSVYGSLKSNRGKYRSYGYDESPFEPILEDRPRSSHSELAVGFGLSVGLVFK